MNKDPKLNDDPNNPEEIKDSTTYITATEDEAYKNALEWLAEFKETIDVYSGELIIPNGSVFQLMNISQDERIFKMYASVRGSQERHNALVSTSITSEEKAVMRRLRQEIYDECKLFLTKLYEAQHAASHTPGDAGMSAMGKAGAVKRWQPHNDLMDEACKVADDKWAANDDAWHNEMADYLVGRSEFLDLKDHRAALMKRLVPIADKYGRTRGKKGIKKGKS